MTVNIWGTQIDPKTGLPIYPVDGATQGTSNRLKERAKKARAARLDLQKRLDRLTSEFESAFAEGDKLAETQKRIAAAAKSNRD